MRVRKLQSEDAPESLRPVYTQERSCRVRELPIRQHSARGKNGRGVLEDTFAQCT